MKRSIAVLAAIGLAAVAVPAAAGEVYQVSTISALLAGGYDGVESMRRVLAHGDFGLGTLEGVDGELVVLDGIAWQARGDGTVAKVSGNATTPFAEIIRFRPRSHVPVPAGLSLAQLEALLDGKAPGSGGILAVRVDGRFARLTVRSEPKQFPPYRPLAEVIKAEQKTFDHRDLDGTLVAFRFPSDVGGVNVPGWHLHFLSSDHTIGGHVLALETGAGSAGLDATTALRVRFAPTVPAAPAATPAAMGEQLKAVEGGGR